jgi:hypothetical protein
VFHMMGLVSVDGFLRGPGGKKNEAVSLAKEPKFRTVVLSRLGAHLARQARWSVDFGAKS